MPDCLPRSTLERFLAGALDDGDEEDVCTHVEECPVCQAELDELVGATAPRPRPAELAAIPRPEFDSSFLERLEQTLSDRDWHRPRWTDPTSGLDRSAGRNGRLPGESPGAVRGYELIGELGRGAMGVVYKAWQLNLGRLTALKMILSGEHAGLNDRARFRAEAEAAASLRHPNIVQIYETGEAGGLPYFSMEYIEGPTLKEWLEGTPKSAQAAAGLLDALARAVDYAHKNGIVHRDLKPSNVLLDAGLATPARSSQSNGDLRAQGLVPRIADFGLAKRIGDSLGTQTGQMMGTPSYMSPEQLAGQAEATGPGVDIYALGCILYEALTGRPPFLDASLEALAARVRREEPVPPRRLQPRCPRNLETICLKCLEKEPARRYESALELADDLARFLAGESISAQAPSIFDRSARFARRNRTLVGGVAGVMAALALGIAMTTFMAAREATARRLAVQSAQQAVKSARQAIESAHQTEAARTAALREAYEARLAAALAAMGQNDIREAARQLESAPVALRGWEWRHLRSRLDQSLAVVAGLPEFRSIAFCPPGERLAVADGRGYSVLSALSGHPLAARTTDGPCHQVYAFGTRSGLRFLLDQSSENTSSFTLTDGEGVALGRPMISTPQCERCGVAIAMSPDGRRIAFQSAAYSDSPLIEVFDAATGDRTTTCGEPLKNMLLGLDFSPDGRRIAAARSEDSRVLIFDADSGQSVAALAGHHAMIRGVDYSPDGRRLASCGDDQTIRVWDITTGKVLHTLKGHVGGVHCVAFSPDGRRLVSGGDDSTVRVWSADGGDAALILRGHTSTVNHVAFSDLGRTIASAALDGTARLWDAMAPDDASVLRGHTNYVYPVAFSPDGRQIATGSWDWTVRLWDAATGATIHTLEGHTNPLGALAFSPDGTLLVSWGNEGTIRFWDTKTGKEIGPSLVHHGMDHRDSVYSLVITPDGKRIGAVTQGGVRFWDLATRRGVATLRLPIEGVRVVAFSPDGGRLAAGGDGASVVVVDAISGELLAEISGFTGRIQSLAFSPDGRYVLTAGMDRVLRLWDTETGRLVRTFAGHSLEVLSAVFHPDGTRIASGGHDRSIRIWDTATGEELVRLTGHTSYIFSLAFSPGGETLVSGSGDCTVRLWDEFPVARRLEARRANQSAGSHAR